MAASAAKQSVDALDEAPTVKKGRTAGRPFRQCWTPKPLVWLDVTDPAPAVTTIVDAIKERQRKRQCGSFVYIDPEHQVYVLSEEMPAALEWIQTRLDWLVGFYQTVRPADPAIPVLSVTVEGLTEDLLDQVQQMRNR